MALKQRLAALPVIGTAMAVQQRTKVDAADQFGAAIAFFGFLSLFPLVALVVAVGGMVLAGQPDRVAALVDGVQQAIPGLGGDTIGTAITAAIDNAGSIGLVGLVGVAFAGLKVANAAQTATNFVFRVSVTGLNPVRQRLVQLGSLVALGLLAVAGVAVSGWVQSVVLADLPGVTGRLAPIGAWLVAALLDALLFWLAYRLYSLDSTMSWRELLPGAVLGGLGWAALKYFGGGYLTSQADSSVVTQEGSGPALLMLGTVIGLLALFYVAGRLYVYGAELSAELAGLDMRPRSGDQDEAADDSPDGLAVDDEAVDDEAAGHATADPDRGRAGVGGTSPTRDMANPASDDREPVPDPDRADRHDEEFTADKVVRARAEARRRGELAAANRPREDGGAGDLLAILTGVDTARGTSTGPDEVATPDDDPAPDPAPDPPGVRPVDSGVMVVVDPTPPEADAVDDRSESGGGSPAIPPPPGSSPVTTPPPPAPTVGDRSDAHPPSGRDVAGAAPGTMAEPGTGRELVPWSSDGPTAFLDDPRTRRVAAAAAAAMVGLAAGWLRRRR